MTAVLKNRWLRIAVERVGAEPPPYMPAHADYPYCTDDDCPQFDGKRCKLLGARPGTACEPVVRAMGEMLEEFEP